MRMPALSPLIDEIGLPEDCDAEDEESDELDDEPLELSELLEAELLLD